MPNEILKAKKHFRELAEQLKAKGFDPLHISIAMWQTAEAIEPSTRDIIRREKERQEHIKQEAKV